MLVPAESSSAALVMIRTASLCLSATILVLARLVDSIAEIARFQGGTQI